MKYILVGLLLSFGVQASVDVKKEGVLLYQFGDGRENSEIYHQRYYLQTDQGDYPLSLSDAFEKRMPIRAWSGKKVSISFKGQQLSKSADNPIQSMELLEGDQLLGSGVTGSQPWVSILCKFSDVASEPEDLNFFSEMYDNQPAGLDHYWREVSYNNINVVGSTAVDWVDLPSPQGTYIASPGSGTEADLDLLFTDCTTAADDSIDFSDVGNGSSYVGINMMFNDDLDCCAWGGGKYATLDGETKVWRTTWNPPWSFANEGVIAHEMGHGFGLPHANNSDGDDNPYDSPWDVMSSATGAAVYDTIYGRLGKHINMSFKHDLGWVSDADGFIAETDTNDIKRVNWTALTTTANEKFIRLPLSDGNSYYIEARQQSGQYESNIVGTAVIIHHVDENRSEPPWVVDGDSPAADYADTEGVMWKVGEIFVDPIDGYKVEVLEQVTNGFRVRIIGSDDLIFWDGFESL